jgi:hypothetical protein
MSLPGLASQFTADCVDSLSYRVSSFSPKSAAIRQQRWLQRPRASLRPGVSWQTRHRCVWSDAARRVTPRCTHRTIDNLVLEPYRRTIISVILLILQHSGGCNVARGDGYELPHERRSRWLSDLAYTGASIAACKGGFTPKMVPEQMSDMGIWGYTSCANLSGGS